MTRTPTLTSTHADVDVAIARLERFVIRRGREAWTNAEARREKLADLLTSLTDLFNVEDQYGRTAAEIFGAGLPETSALGSKRTEILNCIRDLTAAEDATVHIGRLRDLFDDYTVLQWQMFRTYESFLAPGTGGV